MRLVEIESPYGSDDPAVVKENVEYAKKCAPRSELNYFRDEITKR